MLGSSQSSVCDSQFVTLSHNFFLCLTILFYSVSQFYTVTHTVNFLICFFELLVAVIITLQTTARSFYNVFFFPFLKKFDLKYYSIVFIFLCLIYINFWKFVFVLSGVLFLFGGMSKWFSPFFHCQKYSKLVLKCKTIFNHKYHSR